MGGVVSLPNSVPQRSDHTMMRLLARSFGLFLAVAAVTIVLAQDDGPVTMSNEEFASARAKIQEGREAIIREDLHLTAAEEAAFWPLYKDYRASLLPMQDRYVEQITDYVQQYKSGVLTDAYAEEMLENYFDIKSELLRTRKDFIDRFSEILPVLKVVRFYQLENKMNADVDAVLALVVPLVEPH